MTKTCRKCGTAFSEDLSTCPVCKTAIIPNQKESNDPQVTASYAFLKTQLELVTLKSRTITSLLFFFVGLTGLGFFYLQFKRIGWITLILSTVILSVIWLAFPSLGFIFSLALFLLQTAAALYYLFVPDAKDGRGELLK